MSQLTQTNPFKEALSKSHSSCHGTEEIVMKKLNLQSGPRTSLEMTEIYYHESHYNIH